MRFGGEKATAPATWASSRWRDCMRCSPVKKAAVSPCHWTEIRSVEYGRDEVRVERRMQSTVRIGNLDAPGALRELANVLAS